MSAPSDFITLHAQHLQASGVPEHFWSTLSEKLRVENFDTAESFELCQLDYGENERQSHEPVFGLFALNELKPTDGSQIYLIDHQVQYELHDLRAILTANISLRDRLSKMMGCDNVTDAEIIEQIIKLQWRFNNSYQIHQKADGSTYEDPRSMYYLMDEFGSAVGQDDTPNVRIVPFVYVTTGEVFSLLYVTRDIEPGDMIVRDWIDGSTVNSDERLAALYAWKPNRFTRVDFTQFEPDPSYFNPRTVENSLTSRPAIVQPPVPDVNSPLKVFTAYDLIAEYLTDPLFQVVDSQEDAQVLWILQHYRDFNALAANSPQKFVNQFPFEEVLCVKDLLAIVCRRIQPGDYIDPATMVTNPKWLPTTFNINTEFLKFMSYFQHREDQGLDNTWIIKPWNLARGIDTYVTDNLLQITRMRVTQPKIVQKYIDNPVLFYRSDIDKSVKFDFRYIFLLKGTEPIDACIYTNFFLRFANKPFTLDLFEEYEKHFTVMNYCEDSPLYHLKCADFLKSWNDQYPDHPWESVENDVRQVFGETLKAATLAPPPCGLPSSPQSRALFGADLMLEWAYNENGEKRMQVKLLEINYMPDCERACKYYPNFFNDIFKWLFLNMWNGEMFKKIPIIETNEN